LVEWLPPDAPERYHHFENPGKELAVDAEEVRNLLLTKLGLRIEPEMSRYVAAQLAHADGAVAVIGGDARTGRPIRQFIVPAELSKTPVQ
jgi:hypothetical protein